MRRVLLACSAAAMFCLPVSGQPKKARAASMSTFVAVGDSLAAGSQNIGLEQSGQLNGFAAVIARQAGVKFNLPLVQSPGEPAVIRVYQPDDFFPVVGPVIPIPPPPMQPPPVFRANPAEAPDNLAVPSFTLNNALEYRPNATIPARYGDRGPLVLGIPGPFRNPPRGDQPCLTTPGPQCIGKTMIEQAKEKQPTMTLVWLGNNDALIPALFGNLDLLTPVDQFRTDFARLMKELDTTGTDLVVGTIPFITQTPYVTSALELALEFRVTFDRLENKTGIRPGDYVRRSALPLISNILKNNAPGPLPASCPQTATFYVLPPAPCILREADAKKLNERTKAYNRIIQDETEKVDGLLVDTNGFVTWINTFGYVVGNRRLTTRYLGGLFSLDGIHPSNTGYAVIANHFIEKMNNRFRLGIKPVSVQAVWEADPLREHANTLPAGLLCLLGWCDTEIF